jgi:hypothetical protein
MIPNFKTTCENLANGICNDIEEDYKNIARLYFDLVIENENNTLKGLIIDNRYKLSKTIIDTDEGKEAVIIPLRVRPINIDVYKVLKKEDRYCKLKDDISLRLHNVFLTNSLNRYVIKNYSSIKKLEGIYLRKYSE